MSNTDLIKEWIERGPFPYFPPTMDDFMIERFLYVCNNDIKRTKEVLQLFFKFRAETPEFFTNRDPISENLKNILDVVYVFPMPKKTNEGYQVYITHLADSNPDKFDFISYSKMFFDVSDVRMKIEEKIPTGDIPIFDMTGFTLKHLMKLMFNLGSVKKYMRITQEAHPVSLKQIHVINTSPLLEKVLTFLRPLMREEVKKMIHFHTEGSDTLYQFIPRDVIPVEFGGKGASINETKNYWKKQIEENRDWINSNPWTNTKYSESKKSQCITESPRQSFQSLNLD
ncbi:alpha-tocopherol transfer protein-like [Planococcus citri]|uniref:alpha-tocopherol transfer protein-like n=1 Tax=Planococcus citri TaxID=170843 RepID=UPI0031F9A764